MLALVTAALAQEFDPGWPLTTRWAEADAYFEGGARPLLRDALGAEAAGPLVYEVGDRRALLYVPPGDAPEGGWAIYVHIDADDAPDLPDRWREVLDRRRAIFVSVIDAGNDRDVPLRIAWSLDALASAEAAWPIDPDRRVVGGFSGGGSVAVTMGAHWPEVFVGSVAMGRAVMWEEHPIATLPGSSFGVDSLGHLDPEGVPALAGGPRFASITGDADVLPYADGTFSNYEGILDGLGDWWERGIRARVWDVPGHRHAPAPSGAFDDALGWTLDCVDDGSFPPRFGTDHAPPSTPFPEPAADAPEACDPGEAPEGRGARGCGCGPQGSDPGVAGLLVGLGALARRRAGRVSEAADSVTGILRGII